MTYKTIVANMVREDSRNWLKKLLGDNNIEYKWVDTDNPDLQKEGNDNILYSCEIRVYREKYRPQTVTIGGTVDDILGICHSVIWNEKHDIIWMSREETRKSLGIDKFEI